MADRRTDETPLAPPRSLGGPAQKKDEPAPKSAQKPTQKPAQSPARPVQNEAPKSAQRRPLAERMSSALASATGGDRSAERSERGTAGSPRPSEKGATSSRGTDTRTDAKPVKGTKPVPGPGKPGRPSNRPRSRKARLRLTHVDPWSVMKVSFLLSIAFGIVTVISVAVVWSVLGAAGVWESINSTVQEVLGGESGSSFNVEDYVGTSRVMGFTMIVAVVDVVLITAIATLGAFLYNLAAALLGGLEVTWAEDEH